MSVAGASGRELPLVTIVTPAYNRASYLDETIRSVLEQDYPNLEYIVLDDGSTDDSAEVIRKYAASLRFESHLNMGETRTVNRGFSLARGEILGVVNSDDPLYPGAVGKIVERFLARPDLLVAYPDWDMIGPEGEFQQRITTFEYDYRNMIRWHHCVPGPGAFFRRGVAERLGGRDTQFRYVADFDFWLRAGLLGPFERIPEVLATFRTHPDSASVSAKGSSMAEEHIRLVRKIYALPELPEEVLRVRREAFSSAHFVASVVCGPESTWEKRLHCLKAIGYCPWKYLGEYSDRRPHLLEALLGGMYRYPIEARRRLLWLLRAGRTQ